MNCLYCGDELRPNPRGRSMRFCSSRCRVAHHRREKRYTLARLGCNGNPDMTGVLVLELFPGAGLFGKAFEAFGATVVRGPDVLWGGDVREFRGLTGRFDGIIGGPPCQFASRAAIRGSAAQNMIPEFVRVVEECEPRWAVMENVREAKPHAPAWDYVSIRDWDCGGNTHRWRGFWFYGIPAPPAPPVRSGEPAYSVLASNWNRRGTNRIAGHTHLTPQEAARLQGYPDLADRIRNAQPGWLKNGRWSGVSEAGRDTLAVHMLGNGVPAAMGRYIANYVGYLIQERIA